MPDRGGIYVYMNKKQTNLFYCLYLLLIVLPIGMNVDVFREDPASPRWSNYGDDVTLAVTWNTDALGSDVDTVNVTILIYYENIGSGDIGFDKDVVLAENVPFRDGRTNFSRPDVDLSTADVKLFGFIAVVEANPLDE